MKKILKTTKQKRIAGTLLAIIIGLLYYAQGQITNLYVPCAIYQITGLECPGCGVTRMAISFLQFNFSDAFDANAGLFISLPLIAIVFFYAWINWINEKNIRSKFIKTSIIILIVFLILWGIYRNLYYFVDISQLLVI